MVLFLCLFQRALRLVGHLERWLGVGLIGLMVGAITTQVFTRYLFNRPIIWVEEVATYSFIWGVFVGASLGLKYGRHIKIETFVGHLPPRAQAASRILVNLIVIAILWLLLRRGWQRHQHRKPVHLGFIALAGAPRLVLFHPACRGLPVDAGNLRLLAAGRDGDARRR